MAIAGLVIIAICIIVFFIDRSKRKGLNRAQKGAMRVETIKAVHVNRVVAEYAESGWKPVAQSSAKSFGSQPQVTITFQK